MENKVLRDIYDTLLDTDELCEVMPNATGIWEKDKTLFKTIQEGLDEVLLGKEVSDPLALLSEDYNEFTDETNDDW